MFARLLLCALACLGLPRVFAFCLSEGDPGWEPDMYIVAREFQRAKDVVRARSLRETWLDENGAKHPDRRRDAAGGGQACAKEVR